MDAPRPDEDQLPSGDPSSIVRRAPFADSPRVGKRGQEQQQRIIEAALEVFSQVGYHECAVNRITEVAGCSRVSFYQYFSSKEDLFRHLAGRVARELNAAADDLYPVTGDLAGWLALNHWLNRYSQIYDEYEPVFVTFQTAAASDERVAAGSAKVAARTFKDIRSKIKGSARSAKQVDNVTRTLLATIAPLNRDSELLELAAPSGPLTRRRINTAYADVMHRALFGPLPDVNIHTTKERMDRRAVAPPPAPVEPPAPSFGPTAERMRSQLLDAGHQVFVERGYYATRVADIVKATDCSHGTFYRYFDNKTHLFRILAERASRRLAAALDEVPATPDGVALRAWLRGFASTYTEEAAIFTMWSEAISRNDELDGVSTAVIEGTRRRLATFLEPRGWGDPDAEAMVVLVFLDAMTAGRVPAPIETIADMIERGLLDGRRR